MMHSKTEYQNFYSLMKDLWVPVSRETGLLLYMLARNANARHIVEFGTSFGISTLHLAAALRDNGGGRLISTEFEHPEVTEFYHVVVGATLAGEPVFIGGCRRGQQQLFYVRAKWKAPLELEAVLIEAGVGPSNVCVVHEPGRDIIVAANREKAEAALYLVMPED
jgi:hypothetical protein